MEFEFSDSTVVKDLQTVPEQFRGMYAEDKATGTFRLRSDDPGVKGAVEALVSQRKALQQERAAVRDLKAKVVDLSPLSDFGKTPEEIATGIKTKIEELQGKKFDLEKARADIAKGYTTEIAKRDLQVTTLRNQLETILVDNAIRQAVGDKAPNPDLVLPFAKERVRVIEDEGRLEVRVVDDTGTQRFSGITAKPLSIAEYIAEMKANAKFAQLFKSEVKGGSGAAPGGGGRVVAGVADPSKRSATQKIADGLRTKR